MRQVTRDTIIRIIILMVADMAIIFLGRLERGYFAVGAELPMSLLGAFWILYMRQFYSKHKRKDA